MRVRRLSWLSSACVVVAVAAFAGCQQSTESAAPKEEVKAEPLRIAAASDLQAALPKLVEAYKTGHLADIDVTFGSSGQLSQQIKQGAPFDVFMSANRAFVEKLASDGVIEPESVVSYAVGSLVLVWKADGKAPGKLDDLKAPEFKRIALANPETAPYGAAARQALKSAGLWDELESRLVFAENVRQSLQFVQSGNAEVGFVGLAIADVPDLAKLTVDTALYEPIVQGVGVIKGRARVDAARDFVRFVTGDEGQAVLKQFGFRSPTAESNEKPNG